MINKREGNPIEIIKQVKSRLKELRENRAKTDGKIESALSELKTRFGVDGDEAAKTLQGKLEKKKSDQTKDLWEVLNQLGDEL